MLSNRRLDCYNVLMRTWFSKQWHVVKRVYIDGWFAPVIISCTLLLFLYAQNVSRLTIQRLIVPLLVVALITVIGQLVLRFLFKSWTKASLMLGLCWLAFFSYGPIQATLTASGLSWMPVTIYRDKTLFPCFLLVLAIVGVVIYRSQEVKLVSLLKGMSLVFTCLLIFQFATIFYKGGFRLDDNVSIQATDVSQGDSSESKPSIYYIILDKYAADATLKDDYGYDNSQFLDYLSSSGFYIAHDSLTNYPKTSLSIASSLNLNYLDTFKPANSDARPEVSIVLPLLQNNAVGSFLKNHGYNYIHLGSWYIPTATSAIATENYNYASNQLPLDRFQTLILQQSMVAPVLNKFMVVKANDQARVSLEYQDKVLPAIVEQPGPKFVFAHILMPHDPFIYDAQCQLRSAQDLASHTRMYNYLQHVGCANLQAKTLIDDIKADDPGSYIILQADEGPMALKNPLPGDDDYHLGNDVPISSRLERSRILNAYYFPDQDYSQLSQDITPVNSFRILFNKLFKTKYEILPSRTYLFQDHDHIFNMYDGTNILRSAMTK